MSRRTIRVIRRWLPAIAWMTLIFWFSAQPDLPRPPSDLLNLILRKGAHFSVYAVLALTYIRALGGWQYRRLAFVLAVLYAISDEVHQSFTPNRYPSAMDVLIDSAGALAGVWLGPYGQRFIVERVRSSADGRGQAGAEKRA